MVPLSSTHSPSHTPHSLTLYPLTSPHPHTELEALGDDFLAEDEDTSYLDAVSAPEPPTGIPGGPERSKVDGVKVDEFGLPELPN